MNLPEIKAQAQCVGSRAEFRDLLKLIGFSRNAADKLASGGWHHYANEADDLTAETKEAVQRLLKAMAPSDDAAGPEMERKNAYRNCSRDR